MQGRTPHTSRLSHEVDTVHRPDLPVECPHLLQRDGAILDLRFQSSASIYLAAEPTLECRPGASPRCASPYERVHCRFGTQANFLGHDPQRRTLYPVARQFTHLLHKVQGEPPDWGTSRLTILPWTIRVHDR